MTEPNPEPERWLPVAGYEGLYEISDRSRVRSLPHKGGRNRSYGGVILKSYVDTRGYLAVRLNRGGAGRTKCVHAIIAAAFIGPRPDGQEVRHLDGDKANNALTNLAYGTHGENVRDAVRHGGNFNTAKTHCKRGHEFTPENTYVKRGGGRSCRRCGLLATWKRRGKVPDSPRKPSAPQTHCKRVHEFTEKNTYITPNGRRQCRECIRLRMARKVA